MSSHKFICFECKYAVKRDPREASKVLCPTCGTECTYLGVKIPIPPKSKPKLWNELQKQLIEEKNVLVEQKYARSVARRHELEKEIKKLECLEANKGRLSLIKQLRSELERINA
jgi:hypothetical protein